MNEKHLFVHKEVPEDTCKTIKAVTKLMKSQNENVEIFSVEARARNSRCVGCEATFSP